MDDIKKEIRLKAAAEIFRKYGNSKNSIIEEMNKKSDEDLKFHAKLSGIQDEHADIFVRQIRGEENTYTQLLNSFKDQLKTGDIILLTGKSRKSKALVLAQKTIYKGARSSHVALVHADFICVDAIPKTGVSCRLINEVLCDVEDNWRVIRLSSLTEKESLRLLKSSSYYLSQPYKIHRSATKGAENSYCSELAYKIYNDCNVAKAGFPKTNMMAPADFDRLADQDEKWEDVTELVRPFIEFCIEYADINTMISKTFVTGLDLNRKRFDERKNLALKIQHWIDSGKLEKSAGRKMISKLKKLDSSMSHQFWDY